MIHYPGYHYKTVTCKCCGDTTEFDGRTPEELAYNISTMNGYCAYCDSGGKEERDRIRRERAAEQQQPQGGGFFAWLLGI